MWALYERLVARIGPRPTLIERDDQLPAFEVLLAERERAHAAARGPPGEGRVMRAEAGASLARFQDAFARALMVEHARADAAVAGLVVATGLRGLSQHRDEGLHRRPAGQLPRRGPAGGGRNGSARRPPSTSRASCRRSRRSWPTGPPFPRFSRASRPPRTSRTLPTSRASTACGREAHVAADAPALDRSSLAGLDPDTLAGTVLHLHPAARWAWFPDAPIYTIWRRNREESGDGSVIDWRGEGALLTRPDGAVRWTAIDAPACRFLEACAQWPSRRRRDRCGARGR